MCGRYTLKTPIEAVADQFHFEELEEVKPRYNVAPSQRVTCVRLLPHSIKREGAMLRWGLIPSWAKEPAMGMKLINARAETVVDKPAFRMPFRRQRCLVLADGFYEWQREGSAKQPFYIRMKDKRPFAFAGLWDRWVPSEGQAMESCALITTDPNELMATIHNRMPVILPPGAYDPWLDPDLLDVSVLTPFLHPYPAAEMEAFPVSRKVNNPKFDDPACLNSIEKGQE